MDENNKIGFGGSCHWCTEAIFQSLKGVSNVEQGWIASERENSNFSEAIIVHFNDSVISLETLIAVHLHTHSCTSQHNMRSKYRSAIYVFTPEQIVLSMGAISLLQSEFDNPIITTVETFYDFRLNQETYLEYFYKNPRKPFCKNIITPKLRILLKQFSGVVDHNKLTEESLKG
ncbi:peptide-methionine (S)-S-oxide reductase [Dyadobacter sp. CY356]|uniref:peptide-methionine (S)-S-oxide reductase n=1 Tax=Dyadobacter sp. CY356 TaxID=2906442 RepID=UPI002107D755|nr:peptide-methionine (S)-S-oxide reductase [Dyadobacter sp. CY356]MCF0059181.1 peptide-methionine (S)-S-oxide reductase [Dyadobacter sp. CY356]